MYRWIRKRSSRGPTLAVLTWCAWTAIYPGIYGAYASAQAATAIVQSARDGQGIGTDILDESSSAASNSGSTDFDALGMTPPSGWKTKLESYYIQGNAGLTPGNALNKYADARGVLLQDTSCPSSWNAVDTGLSDSGSDYQSMLSVCGQRVAAFGAIAEQDSSDSTIVTEGKGDLSQWQSVTESSSSTVRTVVDECAKAPACDIANAAQTQSVYQLWTSTSNGFPELQAYCASLPAAPTLSDLSAEAPDIASVINTLNNLGYNNSSIKSVGAACSYAQSYVASKSGMSNLNAYTDPSGAYGQTLNTSDFLNTSAGKKLDTEFLPLIEGNPDVFEQFYNPNNCVKKTTYYSNASGTATTPPTTVVQSGSNSNQPVACNTTSEHPGWVTNFPDPNAAYIWGGYNDCQSVPNGDTETFEAVYNNGGNGSSQNAPISATLYLDIDDQGTVTIQGSASGETEQVSYSDNGGNPISANPPDGWISSPVTLYPGTNVITITDKNDDSGSSAPNPAGAQMAIMGSSGQVYIATNTTQWNWVDAPTAPVTTTQQAGQTVTTGSPSASATSDLCTGTVSCLGTECHALINNQNLDFNKAVTASSALSMMQTDMRCAKGTSVAAGNCIPIIFQGHAMYCRTWPFSSVGITNNCCKEGMQGPGIPLGKYIKITRDIFAISSSSVVKNTVLADPHLWAEDAYNSLSTWGEDAWNYVSQPFIDVAESVTQSLGEGAAQSGVLYSSLSSYENAVLDGAAPSAASASSSGLFSMINNFETTVETTIKSYAVDALQALGMSEGEAIGTVEFIAGAMSYIMVAYTAFQILQMIGQLLTACKKEEFTFGNKRKEDDCHIVGTYCAEHAPIIGCIMHKTTACCYQSPLAMIIASQIQDNQPNVAGGYGPAKKPNCAGFTPQQLAQVNWSQINLSQWLAILKKSGLIQTTNQSAAAAFNQNTQDHPVGQTKPD